MQALPLPHVRQMYQPKHRLRKSRLQRRKSLPVRILLKLRRESIRVDSNTVVGIEHGVTGSTPNGSIFKFITKSSFLKKGELFCVYVIQLRMSK